MRAGSLNQNGRIEVRQETKDPEHPGIDIITYRTLASVWYADVSAIGKTGREFLEQQKLNTNLSRALEIRFRSDVKAGMRMVVHTGVLRIVTAYDPDHRAQRMILLCEEVPPRG